MQVAFPLVLDTYEFCSEALKKQLDGPREAARAAADRAAGLEKAAKVHTIKCVERSLLMLTLLRMGDYKRVTKESLPCEHAIMLRPLIYAQLNYQALVQSQAKGMQDGMHCIFLPTCLDLFDSCGIRMRMRACGGRRSTYQFLRAHAAEAVACLAQAAKRVDGSRADAAAPGAGKAAAGARKRASEPEAKGQAPAGEAGSAAVRTRRLRCGASPACHHIEKLGIKRLVSTEQAAAPSGARAMHFWRSTWRGCWSWVLGHSRLVNAASPERCCAHPGTCRAACQRGRGDGGRSRCGAHHRSGRSGRAAQRVRWAAHWCVRA